MWYKIVTILIIIAHYNLVSGQASCGTFLIKIAQADSSIWGFPFAVESTGGIRYLSYPMDISDTVQQIKSLNKEDTNEGELTLERRGSKIRFEYKSDSMKVSGELTTPNCPLYFRVIKFDPSTLRPVPTDRAYFSAYRSGRWVYNWKDGRENKVDYTDLLSLDSTCAIASERGDIPVRIYTGVREHEGDGLPFPLNIPEVVLKRGRDTSFHIHELNKKLRVAKKGLIVSFTYESADTILSGQLTIPKHPLSTYHISEDKGMQKAYLHRKYMDIPYWSGGWNYKIGSRAYTIKRLTYRREECTDGD